MSENYKKSMTILYIISIPLLSLCLLLLFTIVLWKKASKKPKITGDTEAHNNRIYQDFEFFVKVFLALGGAFGYVKLRSDIQPHIERQTMIGIAVIGIITMMALAIFIACHQASKIQRWEQVRFKEWWQWQEPWMLLTMYLLAAALWVAAVIW